MNVVDDVTRECLAAIPGASTSGRRVARELTDLIERRGTPGLIVSDNGTEFTSRAVLAWAQEGWITPLARHAFLLGRRQLCRRPIGFDETNGNERRAFESLRRR